jgi:hypothetical protein
MLMWSAAGCQPAVRDQLTIFSLTIPAAATVSITFVSENPQTRLIISTCDAAAAASVAQASPRLATGAVLNMIAVIEVSSVVGLAHASRHPPVGVRPRMLDSAVGTESCDRANVIVTAYEFEMERRDFS